MCRRNESITVGNDFNNTFVLEQNAKWKSVEIIKVLSDGTAHLRFDESVSGHVKIGAGLVSLGTIRRDQMLPKDTEGLYSAPVAHGDKADLVIGHVSFFLDWVDFHETLPRPLGMEKGDKKNWYISLGVLLFLSLSLFVLSRFSVKEEEKPPERIVTLLPKNAPAKAAMGEKKSSTGGAQKGDAGKVATQADKKPSAADQVRRSNLGSLVSGLTSLGAQAPNVKNDNAPTQAVEQAGTGGFTTEGLKSGGGGKTEGLGRTVGQGEGGFEGTGRLGLSGDAAVEGGTGNGGNDKIVKGGLSRDVIESVIKRRQYRIRLCYERQLNFNPKLAGKIAMHFVIGGNGGVVKANVSEDTMKNDAVKKCVVEEVRSWTFPPPEGGTLVNVDYPFVFESSAHSSGQS